MRKLIVEGFVSIRLTDWLEGAFPGIANSVVARALRQRDIRINGIRTGENEVLKPGDEVAVYIADSLLEAPVEAAWLSGNMVVAVKPQGVLSTGRGSMEEWVSRWLAAMGEPSAAIACHRLDNGTGGLMMLARSIEAEAAARAMMEAEKITKTYHCIVKGVPSPANVTMTAWMVKDEAHSVVSVFDKPQPNGRTAVTEYALLKTDGDRSLLQVTLHTGRTHQIRAHMAYLGHPVLGDDKYGDRNFNRFYKARRQKLWASGLAFGFSAAECPLLAELAGKALQSAAPFMNEL